MKFKDAVKYLRNELGITQVELATGLNMNAITIGRWENGKTIPVRSISSLLLDYARTKGASEKCIDMLTQSINAAAKSRLSLSGESLDSMDRESLRELIDGASFAIYICDMETDEVLYLNQKARDMNGTNAPAIGKKCYECLMFRDSPCEFCHKHDLVKDRFKIFEARRPFDGISYFIQGKLLQWNGRRAQVNYILGQSAFPRQSFSDENAILESVDAEASNPAAEALIVQSAVNEEALTQLKAIIENINGGVSVALYEDDGKVRLAYANDRYYELFGYTKEQFYTELKNPHETMHPDDYERVAASISKVKNTKQAATFRYRIIRRDGSSAYIRCSSSVATVEGVTGNLLISVLTDITKSVQTEQQALVSGKRLEAIMENMNSAVTAAIVNSDGTVKIFFSNDLYYRMFGYTREQFLAEIPNPLMLAFPEDEAAVRDAVFSLSRVGDAKELKYRAVTRDKSIKWINVRISLMSFPDADVPVQLAVYSDITAAVAAQEKLAAQHERIANLLNDTPSGIAIFEVNPNDIVNSMRTVYFNERFIGYSGYSKEEYDALLQSNEFSFLFDEDIPTFFADIKKLCSGEIGFSVDSMVRCHRKDGGFCWLLLTGLLTERRGDNCVINVVMVDITDKKEAIDRQRVSDEMLRLAAETDKRAMIVFDIKNNSCRVESRILFSSKYGDIFENVPSSLIERGIVSPDSIDDIYTLFERLRRGEREVRVSLQLRSGLNKYDWFECSTATVFDADGTPAYSVLVFHNITEQLEKEAVFKKWKQSIDMRPPESFTLFRCNLSRDTCFDEQEGSLLKISFSPETIVFNDRTKLYVDEYVHLDDRKEYSDLLDSDTLLAMFYRGEHTALLDYREVGSDGNAIWRRVTIEMVEQLDSQDIQAFLMYEDIDASKKAEIAAREAAETDPLTGALNRAAFAEKVDRLIEDGSSAQSALIMLDMDGFKLLNDNFGHAAGDEALQEVVAVLRAYTKSGDLICRLGGDEFMVWLKDVPYDAVIGKTALQMCEHIRKSYSHEVLLSASAGIAVYPRDGHSYNELYPNADKALYKAKQSGKGIHAFFSIAEGEQTEGASDAQSSVASVLRSSRTTKRRMLIVDDNEINRLLLQNIFKDEFVIELAKNGAEAIVHLKHFGASISVMLLDLIMPEMDGFEVLKKMQSNVEMCTVPVIVVTGGEDHESLLKAYSLGASEYVSKPVDVDIIKMRVQAVISKAENERLRAQNSYLMLQRDEETKYRTVLDSTGTVVVEYDWRNHVFIYDNNITKHIAGKYDRRGLWQVLLLDMVADSSDVKEIQEMLMNVSNRGQAQSSKLVKLKTPNGTKHWFRINIYKNVDDFGLAEKLIITFNDVHEEVLANDKLLFQATRDALTGLYNRAGFIEKAAELISDKESGYYVMACIDIEKFKVINDQYGTAKGDEILKKYARELDSFCGANNGVCCRVMADNFAVLYPARLLISKELEDSHNRIKNVDNTVQDIQIAIGRCIVDNKSLDVSAIYDRAAIAKDTIKGRYDTHIATYDESMRISILRQQKITAQMNNALESGQFEVWFQPQFNHAQGTLIGAEALVRWRHPEEGLIPPGEFIPIFERNGFVYEVDKYVWEQSCMFLRKWLDMGLDPVPVSVNISRYDVFRPNLVSVIEGLIDKYDLLRAFLRLEITESAFSESSSQIIDVVQQLVDDGFTVEIDDFGSGYSSLNTLKDVPASVLKLDMRFFEKSTHSDRGGSIVEAVVHMAKQIGMAVIAEGVEDKYQADYLKSIGCYYIQGYYYSRPLDSDTYEKMIVDSEKELHLSRMETIETLDSNLFWDPKSMETLIFNSYVGGACIFEYTDGKIELLRINEQYIKELNGLVPADAQLADADFLRFLDDKDKLRASGIIQNAAIGLSEASCEFRLTNGRQTEYIRMSGRIIARMDKRVLCYGVIHNLTEQREAERKERDLSHQMQAIMNHIHGGVTAVVIRDDNSIEIVFSNDGFYELYGYTKEQFESEVPNLLDLILPEDLEKTTATVIRIAKSRNHETYEFRCRKRDGSIMWTQITTAVISMSDIGDTVLLGIVTDITKLRNAEQEIHGMANRLQTVMDSMISGLTAVAYRDGNFELLFANSFFYAMHGLPEGTYALPLADMYKLLHPDDRERVIEHFMNTKQIGQLMELEYRVVCPGNDIRWLKAVTSVTNLTNVDIPVQITIYTDITEQKEAADQLRFLNDSAHDILAQSDSEKALYNTLKKLLDYFKGERSYIFELDDAAQTSDNTYEICSPGVTPEIDSLKGVPYAAQQYWFDAFHKTGFMVISDVAAIDDSEAAMREILLRQAIRSIIVVPLWRDGKLIGYIGIDNPTVAKNQAEQLIALSDYIAVLLTRRDLTHKIEHDREVVQQLMDDSPGGFLRVEMRKDSPSPIVSFNDGFCNLLGMTRDEVMEAYGNDALKCINMNNILASTREEQTAFARREQYTSKCHLRKKDGSLVSVMVFGRFVRDENGKTFLNSYFTDMSKQDEVEKLRTELLENLPSGAALCEYDGKKLRAIHINKHYWELIGRKTMSEEDVASFVIFHPEDREGIIDELKAALRQERNASCIARILCGDGSYKPFSITTNNVKENNGKYLIYVTFNTISEKAMSIQEMLPVALSTMMENTDDMAYVKDRELRYICVSKAVADMAGIDDPRELIGKSAEEIFGIEFAERFDTDDRGVLESRVPRIGMLETIPQRDRQICLARTSKYPIMDASGSAIGIYCVSHDITTQKENESQLALLTSTIPGGLAAYSISGKGIKNLYFNDGFFGYSGYTREEYLAMTAKEPLTLIFPEDRINLLTMVRDFKAKKQDGMSGECSYRCRTKSGGTRYMQLKAVLSQTGEDSFTLNAVQMDITERIESEKRQAELLDNLPFGAAMYEYDGSSLTAIHINRQYAELVNREVDISLSDFTPIEAIHPDDRKLVFDELRSAVSEKRNAACDIRLLYGENEYLLFHLDARIVGKDDGKYLLYVAYERISDKEKELQETSEQLKLLSDSIPGGIATFRCQPGSIEPIYFNEGICDLTNYSREDFESKSISVLGLIFEEDRPIIKNQIELLINGETSLDYIVRIHIKGGGFKWVECMASLIKKENDLTFIVSAVLTDVTARQEEKERLRVSEELNRIAIDQSGKIITSYNVEERTLTLPDSLPEIFELPKLLRNMPEEQVRLGRISTDTADAYCGLFYRIASGDAKGSAVYRQNSTIGWRWLHSQFTTVFSSDKKPVYAVVSFTDITEQRNKEAIYARWTNSLSERPYDSFTLVRCNLNKSNVVDSWDGGLLKVHFTDPLQSFNSRTKEYTARFVYADDREDFRKFLNSDTMLAEYHRGHRTDSIDYREQDEIGNIRWLRLNVDLVEYPDTTDVEAYLMFEDVDEEKRSQLNTLLRAETDPLTGLLNRSTFAQRVNFIIENSEQGTKHALLMFDIDGFKLVNDVFGHGAGDQALIDIANRLTGASRKHDLVGRLGGDEFFVLLTDIPNRVDVAKKAQQLCDITNKRFNASVHISSSIGIAIYPQDGGEFESLYKVADETLYRVKNSGKNGYAFADSEPQLSAKSSANGLTQDDELGQNRRLRRMLVVDDSSIDRTLLSEVFKNDYLIDTAEDGATALTKLRHYGTSIAVVLLDLMMPGIDGYEVLRKIQNNEVTRTIPVIVVSGDDDRETILKVIEAGAYDLMKKPIDTELLRIRVKSAISKVENERLSAQNSYLSMRNAEVNSYKSVLEHSGILVISFDCGKNEFSYSSAVSGHLAGMYDERAIWDIFTADAVADGNTVDEMKILVQDLIESREQSENGRLVLLKTKAGDMKLFRFEIFKESDEYGNTSKIIMTLKELSADIG